MIKNMSINIFKISPFINMIQFQNIPKFIALYQSLKSLYVVPFQQRIAIKKSSHQYRTIKEQDFEGKNLPLTKFPF